MPLSEQQESALAAVQEQLRTARIRIEPRLALRLATFCVRENEDPSAVVHDALSFYLDELQYGGVDFTPLLRLDQQPGQPAPQSTPGAA
jgi:hypothetical protein